MKPALQKLQKFFKLEAERNYDNRAVVGGLERMLEPWQAEALADGLSDELIQAVFSRLRDYAGLSPTSRAEALEGLWRRIQRESGETLSALQAPILQESEGMRADHAKGKSIPQRKKSNRAPQSPKQGDVGGLIVDETEETPPSGIKEESIIITPHPVVSHSKIAAPSDGPPAALNASITVLPGVGPRHGQTLARLGLITLGDMLYYFPRRYDDYTQLKPINRLWYGEEVTVIGTTENVATRTIKSGRFQIVEAIISDGSGALRVTWFNQPWIAKRLQSGMQIVLSGKVDQYLGRFTMNNPEWEPLEQQSLHTNRIVPVYPLTANITQRWMRRLMYQVVTYWAPRVTDPLPDSVVQSAELVDLPTALLQMHFPDSEERLKAARHRMAFDEIFLLQLGVMRQKYSWQSRTAHTYDVSDEWLHQQVERLPFVLTGAQQRTLQDVRHDLASGRPMNRLLQGDVGSGKTVIAALAVAVLAQHSAQSAIMAPTGILADQHHKSILRLLTSADNDDKGIENLEESRAPILQASEIRLLTSSTPETEKQEIQQGLKTGLIKLIVGTHALIEDPITFANLQLIVVDEQHRFGVEQRALLRAKGDNPHLLVMTATPIPRSLALTIYGDLDLSLMDEMPPGRQPIETQVFYPRERERAYTFIRGQIERGRQAFIIYPLVEESENVDTLSAVEEYVRLQRDIFPTFKLGLLHGRMKADEKDAVMTQFRDGELDILISTAVVEVGVDIPNASVMLIEGANRFGLAQLHQFRGRVGRGAHASYCILIPDGSDEVENERLAAMAETNDGFVLAERDLEQRGPGEFLGTRQSGYSQLRLANLADVHLIEKARKQALAMFELDPELEKPEHRSLNSAVQHFWSGGQGDIS
jgi:ATP-dependent DNA helicase RecG